MDYRNRKIVHIVFDCGLPMFILSFPSLPSLFEHSNKAGDNVGSLRISSESLSWLIINWPLCLYDGVHASPRLAISAVLSL